MERKLSIFLSHSHKDIDIVRKFRDLLELMDCEPILFYLKCLGDDRGELEDFIKREIEARDIFIYCKSPNAENSRWVRKELEYIRSIDSNRLYTFDIGAGFSGNAAELLDGLAELIRKNTVILYYSEADSAAAERIGGRLREYGFDVRMMHPETDKFNFPSMIGLQDWEYTKLHDMYGVYFDREVAPRYAEMSRKGIIVPLISSSLYDGGWSSYMASKNISWFLNQADYSLINVLIDPPAESARSGSAICWDGSDKTVQKIAERAIELSRQKKL